MKVTRNEAIQILEWFLNGVGNTADERQAIDLAIESLSADTFEVVRCKDCIHRIDRRLDLGHFMCEKFYGQGDVSDENFCQWGERR